MEKMLLLLLGLAINGEFKEKFIDQIQQKLETQIQIQLIPFIQMVTDDLSFSISKSILLQLQSSANYSPSTQHSNLFIFFLIKYYLFKIKINKFFLK
jgi:hypothetical protein